MPVTSAPRETADDDDDDDDDDEDDDDEEDDDNKDADDEYDTRLSELSIVVVDSDLGRFD